jgi:hypothetical protein
VGGWKAGAGSRKGASQSGKDAISAPGQDMQITPRRGRCTAVLATRSWNNLLHHARLQSRYIILSRLSECECDLHRRRHDSTSSCHRYRGSSSGTRAQPISGWCLMKAPVSDSAIPARCRPRGPVEGRTLAASTLRLSCTCRAQSGGRECSPGSSCVCWASVWRAVW